MKKILFFLLFSVSTHAEWELDKYDIDSVYDGDTFYIDLKGLPDIFGKRLPIRLRGVNTPEKRSRCPLPEDRILEKIQAERAKEFVEYVLMGADKIDIKNVERGSFFRVEADVFVDGESLGKILIDKGYALLFTGSTVNQWCKNA